MRIHKLTILYLMHVLLKCVKELPCHYNSRFNIREGQDFLRAKRQHSCIF